MDQRKLPKRAEVLDGPDEKGAFTFFLFHEVDYTPGHPDGEYVHRERGQIFHCAPGSIGLSAQMLYQLSRVLK